MIFQAVFILSVHHSSLSSFCGHIRQISIFWQCCIMLSSPLAGFSKLDTFETPKLSFKHINTCWTFPFFHFLGPSPFPRPWHTQGASGPRGARCRFCQRSKTALAMEWPLWGCAPMPPWRRPWWLLLPPRNWERNGRGKKINIIQHHPTFFLVSFRCILMDLMDFHAYQVFESVLIERSNLVTAETRQNLFGLFQQTHCRSWFLMSKA